MRKAVRSWTRTARGAPRTLRDELLLLRSGVFDREWFEAQCGRSFSNDLAAAYHFVRSRVGAGYSPHPLIEPDFVQAGVPRRRFARSPALHYLSEAKLRGDVAPHPAFDVDRARRELRAQRPQVEPEDVFLAWVRQAGPATPVPVPSGMAEVSWSDFRRRALASVARWNDHRAKLLAASPVPRLPTVASTAPRRLGTGAPAVASDEPLVSVVMATWNRASSLRAAITSVLDQHWRNLELLVVDDGSEDDTPAVVAGLAHFDRRVRLVRLPRSGVCAARNAGLALATGSYVAFLDSDNTWRPDFLRGVVTAMVENGWQVAHGALQINGDHQATYRATEATHESLLVVNTLDLNVLVVSRELLEEVGGFDESLRRAVDYDLVLRLTARAESHFVGIVGADYAEGRGDAHRISNSEPMTWNAYVRGRHLVDMAALAARPRRAGLVSVVLPAGRQLNHLVEWLRLTDVSLAPGAPSVELVVTGVARRSQHCILALCGADRPVRVVLHQPRDGLGLLTNVGAAVAEGEYLLLARPNATVPRAALRPLVDALADPAVAIAQPLVERSDMTVASAGAVFAPTSLHPSPFLEGFPVSDAERLGAVDLPAALGPVIVVRGRDFGLLEGMNPLFGNSYAEVDLSLRAARAGLGVTRLVPSAVITARAQGRTGFEHDSAQSVRLLTERWHHPPSGSEELWSAAGFGVLGFRPFELPGTQQPWGTTWGLAPQLHRNRSLQVTEGVPRLRWAIDTAAPAGSKGENWGDRHFARSLAAALESRGQQVAVDHREARTRASRLHDDVVLVLRGLDDVVLQPHPVTMLWVISHPELVSPWEVSRYDAVFAASASWSAARTAEWQRPVRPLLQCTDPRLFNPRRGQVDSGPAVLFVGNSRKLYRPVLRRALATGAEVAVYGDGWKPFIDSRHIKSASVPNAEIGALYGSAGLVLNDHWDDMRREGFISNRLFDAVACGARVVSDDIPGLSEVFGSSVAVCETQEDMDHLVRAPYVDTFPDQGARTERAERVLAEHSFDARAAELLEAALRVRAERPLAPALQPR